MLDIGDVGNDFLQGLVGLKIPVQDIGIAGMFHTSVRGGRLALPDIAMNAKSFHGTPDGRIAQLPVEPPFQSVANLAVAHHGIMGMNVGDTGI